MKCKTRQEELAGYVLGVLGESAAQRVQQHVSRCLECQGRIQILQTALKGLQLQTPPWPNSLSGKVLARVRTSRLLAAPKFQWWIPALGTVALALFILGPGFWFSQNRMTQAQVFQSYQEDLQAVGFKSTTSEWTGDELLDGEWLGLPAEVNRYLD